MSEAPPQAWFFTKSTKQYGPVVFEELKFVAASGELHPRQDMVWTSGMGEWKPAGEIEGLFERVAVEPLTATASVAMAATANPYQASLDDSAERMMALQRDWPGVARAPYFVGSILLSVANVFLPQLLVPYAKGYEPALLAVPGLIAVLSIMLGVKRLQNVGMSGWWYLGFLVPFLNFWVAYRTVVCPPGYAYHRKLDGAGIFLAALYWLLNVIALLVFVAVLLVVFGVVGDPEMQKQFQESIRQLEHQRP